MKVLKDKLVVSKIMKQFPIHQYIHTFLKTFGLGNITEYVYQFIGDDMYKKVDIFKNVFWIGTMY